MFVIPNHPVTMALRELKRRGVQIKFITEITSYNLGYCKQLMETCELSHLDEVKGNFAVSDGIHYSASPKVTESSPPLDDS